MKLYHGTSEPAARLAKSNGLLPKNMAARLGASQSLGVAGNWGNSVPSNKDCVYLTSAYPIYFAVNAVDSLPLAAKVRRPELSELVIMEIDTDFLDPALLYPDEDYMEQNGRGEDDLPKGWSMEKRTEYYRDRLSETSGTGLWEESVQSLSSCAYGGPIRSDQISRICFLKVKDQARLVWAAMDAQISVIAYRFCGFTHEIITAYAFDGIEKAEEMYAQLPDQGQFVFERTIEFLRYVEATDKRNGILVRPYQEYVVMDKRRRTA